MHRKAKHEENQHNDVQEQRNPSAGSRKTKEKNLTAQRRRSGRIKLLLPGALTEKRNKPQTLKGYRGERVGDGLSPVFGERQTLGTSKEVVPYHGIP